MRYEGTVNKANIRLWVAGLRSGIFPQGTSRLKRIGADGVIRYCCLGVVCDIARIHGVGVQENPGTTSGGLNINGSGTLLTPTIIEWLGLKDADDPGNPVVGIHENRVVSAGIANDELRWDFNQIADGIEDYYGLNEPYETGEGGS